MRSVPQSGFSPLSFRIGACVLRDAGGLPGLDFQRHHSRYPALCHLTAVAGFMTRARFFQPDTTFIIT